MHSYHGKIIKSSVLELTEVEEMIGHILAVSLLYFQDATQSKQIDAT